MKVEETGVRERECNPPDADEGQQALFFRRAPHIGTAVDRPSTPLFSNHHPTSHTHLRLVVVAAAMGR